MLRSNCLRKIFTGGSLLLFIPILEWVAVPHASRLTTDFNYTAELFSVDNLYDETEQRFSGNVLSVSKFNYSTDSITQNGILLIKNDFEVKKPSGEPIFAVERFYGIHPKTQAHVQGVGDRDRTGYLFAPPNVKDKTSFEYWHINYNTPVTMHFTAEEHIAGLKVYRYSGNLIADQTENLGFLPGVPEQRGVELDVFLEIWIDPESRHLIKFEDYATGWFYNIKTHERLNPWNKFHNEFKQSSILEHVQKAKSIQYNIKLLKYYIPILILVFCIFLYISCRIKKNELEIHLPKLIGFTVFGLIMGLNIFYFYFEKSNQNQLTLEETEDNAGKTLSYIKNELDNCKLILNLLRFEYEKKSDITEHQFHSTASFLLKRSSAIKALAYIPVVNEHERSLFEKSLIARGANTLGFTEFDFTKKLKGASQRTVYAPVFFIEPLEGNTSVLGFDLLSDSSRIATLEAAKKTRDLTVTAPIKLVQETDSNRFGIIIFNPVFKNGKLKGYFSGVFDIQSLMNTALNSHEIEDEVSFIVYDVLPNQTKIFYQTPGYRSSKEQPMAVTKQIPYLNRVFRFNFYLDEPKDLTMGYILLSIGTLLSIISGLLSFRILNDKTTQLTEHSQHLHRATQVLQHKNMQLMDFCNIVSHNLRAPLANISMLIDYAEQCETEEEKAIVMNKLRPVVDHINQIFIELVDSIQIQQDVEVKSDKLNLELIFNKVIRNFDNQIQNYKVSIEYDFNEAPVIDFPVKYLESIYSNLLSNAIKFRSDYRNPIIKLKTTQTENGVVLSVNDNGIGIDLNLHKDRIFKIRNTFHKRPDAKGFGLFMTKTQVEAMGGEIWVESTPNEGSTFFVRFPNP